MKYLISGYGPGDGGVGRLMKTLVPEYEDKGYKIIYKRKQKYSVRNLLQNGKYKHAIQEYILRCLNNLIFFLRVFFIKQSDIIFMHPQTVSYFILFKLIKKNNLFLYILDNSFFCICSYNTHPIENIECLNCLGEIKPLDECKPMPVKIDKEKNINYLLKLQKISNEITFYAQNRLQSILLKKHFGERTKIQIVGMDTKEISSIERNSKNPKKYNYDVVFHGASIKPKGINYVLKLAEYLPKYSFLIPDKIENVKKNINCNIPSNIIFKSMDWESGLYHEVRSAKIVINPSLWSAPIEGALIKSAASNDNVATVISEYGFENEIDCIKNHIRLEQDPMLGYKKIEKVLMETTS